MKWRETRGTKQVFSFTLTQMMKSKGLIVSLIITLLVTFLAYPIKAIIDGNKKEHVPEKTSIEQLMVLDESPLNFLEWFQFDKGGLEAIEIPKIAATDKDYDALVEELKTTEENKVLLRIRHAAEEGAYYFTFVRGVKSNVAKSDIDLLNDAINNSIRSQLIGHMNVTDEQLDMLHMAVETELVSLDMEKLDEPDKPGEEEKGSSISMNQYVVTLGALCIIIMLVSLCAEYIASSVVMEKSSKVVEYLLTSVRPMALLCGKVMAVSLIVAAQIVLMVLAAATSVIGYHTIVTGGNVGEGVQALKDLMSVLSGIEISFAQILVIIPLILCGVLFYSMIGGIIAAGVKSVEELQEGMKTFTMCLFIGAYGSMFIVIFDLMGSTPDILRYIGYFLPLSSVYILPGYLISGKAELWMAVVALVIELIAVVLMFKLAARIYEYLMYYRGQKLKLKDYFRIYKQEKGGKNNE